VGKFDFAKVQDSFSFIDFHVDLLHKQLLLFVFDKVRYQISIPAMMTSSFCIYLAIEKQSCQHRASCGELCLSLMPCSVFGGDEEEEEEEEVGGRWEEG